ncbi:MAG: TetR/AcrR family transcriptional regulator [Pseudomonadales bacterium]|nr:TetR/AcrR family transcriptional regulator [Pseudomonadales bacterium]
MSPATVSAPNQQNTKTRIIESARDIYLSEGLQSLSMRKVAKQAGLSTMATYRHFENKDDLISHVIMEGFRIFQSYFYKALEGKTPAERLILSADSYYLFATENPKYYEVMFMSVSHVTATAPSEQAQDLIRASIQFLYDRVAECVDAGLLDGPASKRQVLHLWSHSHGLISLYLSGHIDGNTPFKTLYQESMAVMMKGLGFKKEKLS